MKRHIEFLGLPGSGKSTLYNKIINQRYDNLYSLEKAIDLSTKRAILNYQSNNKLKVVYRYLIYQLTKNFIYPVYKSNRFIDEAYRNYLIGNSGISKKIIDLFDEFNLKIDEKEKLYNWLDKLISEYSLIKEYLKSNESAIIDEGFVHRGVAYCLRRKSKLAIDNFTDEYLKVIPIPDVLIYIEIDINSSLERMESRGGLLPILSRNSYQEQKEKLRDVQTYIEKTIEQLSAETKIIKVNNTNSLKSSFNLLNREIKKIV